MATQVELAALAINAYTPSDENELKIADWQELTTLSRQGGSSGFGASVFQGPGGEIVIAFRGTDTEPLFNIDWVTGNTAALGLYNAQVREAIEVVADVMAALPAGTPIRLTGHSLGGGLASLMAVFFDLNATVFAPAPFELTARSESLQDLWPGPGVLPTILPTDLVARYYADYRAYQTQRGRALNADFAAYGATFTSGSSQARSDLFMQRELRVSGRAVTGEILEAIRFPWSSVGTIGEIDVGATTLGSNSVALHSMPLHAALVADGTLAQASRQLPSLLEFLSDETLYASNIQTDRVNVVSRLLNDHLSGDGSSLLESFSQDALRLGTQGSTQIAALRDGLLAALIERYYFVDTSSTDSFFQQSGNGIQFDVSTIEGSDRRGQQRLLAGVQSILSPEHQTIAHRAASSASLWTVQAGTGGLSTSGDSRSEVQIGSVSVFNTLRGESGDDLLINGHGGGTLHGGDGDDVLLGGNGADVLSGGDVASDAPDNDYLFGGGGNDTLIGGHGNDQLYGGTNFDTYTFFEGDGSDIVMDDGGEGEIYFEGVEVEVGDRIAEETWQSADKRLTITRHAVVGAVPGTYHLTIRDQTASTVITVRFWQNGQLGLNLADTPIVAGNPSALTLTGDYVKRVSEDDNVTYLFNSLGNYQVDPNQPLGPQADVLMGTEGDNLINGGELNDALSGFGGNDTIEGGAGDDVLSGGLGADTLNGGEGRDYIYGSGWGDMYLPERTDEAPPTANGTEWSRGFGWVAYDAGTDAHGPKYGIVGIDLSTLDGDEGNTIDGGIGEDLIRAGSGADVVHGGADNDDIQGLAGKDVLYGDAGNDRISGDGVIGSQYVEYTPIPGNDVLDGGTGEDALTGQGGDDVLYGGDDNDQLWGDQSLTGDALKDDTPAIMHGNDYLDGGNNDDQLVGGGKNDTLYGGSGNDSLFGDSQDEALGAAFHGVDMLDGGDDDDYLEGGGNDDTLRGGAGNDTLIGDTSVDGHSTTIRGADTLDGGADNDRLFGGALNDRLYGGSGNDTLSGDGSVSVVAVADQGDDYLDGGAGDDILSGGGGADILIGGTENDQLYGEDSDTPASIQGDDYLDGGDGDDILVGGGGADVLLGGDGVDTLSGEASDTPMDKQGADYLDGGAGNDTLVGGGGADILNGGTGDDYLYGESTDTPPTAQGNDYLDGGEGNDVLLGAGGEDTLTGGSGDDHLEGDGGGVSPDLDGDDYLDGGSGSDSLSGGGGSDVLLGGSGNDQLFGDASDTPLAFQGNDYLDGGAGDDYLSGSEGSDTLLGGEGNDTLQGGNGNDTLVGGAGVDLLYGGAGDDTYVFNEADLEVINGIADGVIDTEGRNNIVINGGLTLDGLTVTQGSQSGSILLSQNNNSLGLVVRNGLSGSVASYAFSDGTVLSASSLIGERYTGYASQTDYVAAATLLGGTLNDTIAGYGNDSIISGGRGNDRLTGGEGSTTYEFNLGDGADEINDVSRYDESSAAKRNTISFGAGITAQDVSLSYHSSAFGLTLLVGSGGDSITLDQFDLQNLTGTYRTIDTLQFKDGTSLGWAEFLAQTTFTIQSAAAVVQGSAGRDAISGDASAQTLSGGAGDDRLNGLGGNDLLVGGSGDDVYVVDANSGNETIDATDLPASLETLELNSVTTAAVLSFFRYNDNLYIKRSDSADTVMVLNHFTTGQIDTIRLANGTIITSSSIVISSPTALITAGADLVYGTQNADSLVLGAGDVVYGGQGNDNLQGGQSVYGEDGNDILTGDSGTSYIYGGSGDDRIEGSSFQSYGGDGNDVIRGRNGIHGDAGNDDLQSEGDQAEYVYGGDGDDVLAGNAWNGRWGGDYLEGEEGNDTYLITVDSNGHTIRERDATGNDVDTLHFASGISRDQTTFRSNRWGDLVVEVRGTDGSVLTSYRVEAALTEDGPGKKIEQATFADEATVITASEIEALARQPTSSMDWIRGTAGNDTLYGGGSHDQLFGLAGDDLLIGGQGVDDYYFGAGFGQDVITDTESGQAPEAVTVQDTIKFDTSIHASDLQFAVSTQSSNDLVIRVRNTTDQITVTNFFAATPDGIERIEVDLYTVITRDQILESFSISGTAGVDVLNALEGGSRLLGLAGDDTLNGNTGNDYLDGGVGADQMLGRGGDDRYIVDNMGDVVSEQGGGGIDTVESSITFVLPTDVDNLMLTGSNSINGTGNSLANLIEGNNADNTLIGGGGADILRGGYGNDVYVIDSADDQAVESMYEGTDRVESSVTYTLAEPLENLTLTGTANVNATGNSGANVIVGNAGANVIDGLAGADSLRGGAGDDLYLLDAFDTVTETLNEGVDTVRADFSITLAANVENLILTGAENIDGYGNGLANNLQGNSGNNRLNGLGGADVLAGGTGNDIYEVDDIGDVVVESAGAGNDLVFSTVSYALSDNVESLSLSLGGGLNATGNALANTLYGNYQANVIDGGLGVDLMFGGNGSDTYVVDDSGDQVFEDSSTFDADTIFASVSFSLASEVENLVLTGAQAINGTGNVLNNVLTGNSANNTLIGGSGADTLDGGAGNDRLEGGSGNDSYNFSTGSGQDLVVETSANAQADNDVVLLGSGILPVSVVVARQNFDLVLTLPSTSDQLTIQNFFDPSYPNGSIDSVRFADGTVWDANTLRNMTALTTGTAGNDTLDGTSGDDQMSGLAGNDTLNGNAGNDTLDGGTGTDSMNGGLGNDIYVVDNAADVVTEAASQGTDRVDSSVSWTLGANVESLVLTGSANINGTGNSLANSLTGNSNDNVLDGGTGADTMIGGAGNDTYVVNVSGDVVAESAGQGTDLVKSGITYTLGSNVENLTLTGTSAINGTGNTLDNLLTGNSANNTLTGGAGNDTLDGGAGTDKMVGGAGNDIYYVNVATDVTTESSSAGIDLVNSAVTRTLAANIELLFLTGSNAINGTGNTLANLLRGNSVNNTLVGGGGTDILEGGAGNDKLSDTTGNTLLNGGAGTDTLTGGSGKDLLIGGLGNDALTTGSGADIIAFNKGDGQDTVAISTTKDNTLSIGGGARYADLLFTKSGNDLVLKIGATDQITMTGYYANTANRSVNRLQVVIEGTADYVPGSTDVTKNNKIESFDFGGLVSAFDAARTANPSLTSWALSGALAAQYLTGSDTAALGGDLAYRYARLGSLSEMSFSPAISILGNASFGTAAQTLQPLTGLQDLTPRLN